MSRKAQMAQIRSLIHETDKGQKTDNLYLLASRHIRAGGNTDIDSINRFLLPYGLSVTDEDLKALVAIKPVSFNLPLSESERLLLNETLRGGGVVAYIFERSVGKVEQYVGSSINMRKRLSYYFAPSTTQNESRAIMSSFASYGINTHQLHVYPIDPLMYQDALDVRERKLSLARALEQYYIFKINPSLNVSKLAGGKVAPPIADSKLLPLYMYNREGTVLRAITTTRTLLGTGLMSEFTYNKAFYNGKQTMGFMLSRELKDVPHDLLTHDELIKALIEGKANRYINREKAAMIKSPNPQAMGVRLTDLLDPNKPQFEFTSKTKAHLFTRNKYTDRTVHKIALSVRGRTSFEFKGWLVEFL